jgi:signal transduction histidine kinase
MFSNIFLKNVNYVLLFCPIVLSYFVFKQYIISIYEFIVEGTILILLFKNYRRRKNLTLIAGFLALFFADTIFSTITIFEPEDPAWVPTFSEVCYSLFLICLSINVFKDFSSEVKKDNRLLYLAVLVTIVFGYFQYEYLVLEFFNKVQESNPILRANFFVYSFIQTLLVGMSFSLSFLVVQSNRNTFLQAINILVFSDFAIRYFTMQGHLIYGFSFIEQGWMFAGMLFLIYIYNLTEKQVVHLPTYTAFNSLRCMLSLSVALALSLLLFGLFISNSLIASDANAITCILVVFGLTLSVSNHIALVFYQRLQQLFNQWHNFIKITIRSGASDTYIEHDLEKQMQFMEFNQIVQNYKIFINEILALQTKLIKSANDKKLIELATQISHDIRSPVMALQTLSKSLGSEVDEDKKSLLNNAAKRINDIANGLVTEYRQKVTTSYKSLNTCLQEIISEKKLILPSNILLEFSYDKEVSIPSNFDPTEIQRVISNIINNSIEAIESKKGKIEISLKSDVSKVYIKVRDNGMGIEQHLIPTVFNKNISYSKAQGSGLGLHHAKEYIESINGKISIISNVNEFTEVTIELPAYKEPVLNQ